MSRWRRRCLSWASGSSSQWRINGLMSLFSIIFDSFLSCWSVAFFRDKGAFHMALLNFGFFLATLVKWVVCSCAFPHNKLAMDIGNCAKTKFFFEFNLCSFNAQDPTGEWYFIFSQRSSNTRQPKHAVLWLVGLKQERIVTFLSC